MSRSQACGCSNMVVPFGARSATAFRRLTGWAKIYPEQDRQPCRTTGHGEMWTQTLPPIAFEMARKTKELVHRVGGLTPASNADEFS